VNRTRERLARRTSDGLKSRPARRFFAISQSGKLARFRKKWRDSQESWRDTQLFGAILQKIGAIPARGTPTERFLWRDSWSHRSQRRSFFARDTRVTLVTAILERIAPKQCFSATIQRVFCTIQSLFSTSPDAFHHYSALSTAFQCFRVFRIAPSHGFRPRREQGRDGFGTRLVREGYIDGTRTVPRKYRPQRFDRATADDPGYKMKNHRSGVRAPRPQHLEPATFQKDIFNAEPAKGAEVVLRTTGGVFACFATSAFQDRIFLNREWTLIDANRGAQSSKPCAHGTLGRHGRMRADHGLTPMDTDPTPHSPAEGRRKAQPTTPRLRRPGAFRYAKSDWDNT
jgi:hypothetical protein